MKTNLLNLLSIFLLPSFLLTCGNDDNLPETAPAPSYESYINEKTAKIISDLNFTIHKGDNPPNVEGKYLSSQIVVPASNIIGDLMPTRGVIGEMTYNLYNQQSNNTINPTLTIDYNENMPNVLKEEYSGEGTLITGSDNQFTIYSIYDGELTSTSGKKGKAKLLYMISAKIAKNNDGENIALSDVHSLLVMLDDYRDPNNMLIDNGEARMFRSLENALIQQ